MTTTTRPTPTYTVLHCVRPNGQIFVWGDDSNYFAQAATLPEAIEKLRAAGTTGPSYMRYRLVMPDGTPVMAPGETVGTVAAATMTASIAATYTMDARGLLHRPNGQYATRDERKAWDGLQVRRSTCTACKCEEVAATSLPLFQARPSQATDMHVCGQCMGNGSKHGITPRIKQRMPPEVATITIPAGELYSYADATTGQITYSRTDEQLTVEAWYSDLYAWYVYEIDGVEYRVSWNRCEVH